MRVRLGMTGPEMGEYLVGAYLKLLGGCEYVDYNARFLGGGPRGLGELDVVGFDVDGRVAYLCEVVTHIRGLLYGKGKGYKDTLERIQKKHERQKSYMLNSQQSAEYANRVATEELMVLILALVAAIILPLYFEHRRGKERKEQPKKSPRDKRMDDYT